jgi:hypothetical protein
MTRCCPHHPQDDPQLSERSIRCGEIVFGESAQKAMPVPRLHLLLPRRLSATSDRATRVICSCPRFKKKFGARARAMSDWCLAAVVAEVRFDEEVGETVRRSVSRDPWRCEQPVRAWKSVGGSPRFISRGQGARITDVDGQRRHGVLLGTVDLRPRASKRGTCGSGRRLHGGFRSVRRLLAKSSWRGRSWGSIPRSTKFAS